MSREVRFGVRLTGDHRGAQRSIRVTEREVQRLRGEMNRTQRSLATTRRGFQSWASGILSVRNAIAPLVGVLGVGMLARMGQSAIASTAALQDQADVAGINVERFQELTKGFSDLGNVADSVTAGALRRFNRRFGLAQEGSGAALNTLRLLNIELDQGTGPALEQAITRLARMEDSARRAAAASQLFGEDAGPQLAAALGQGERALRETVTALRESGRVIDEETIGTAREVQREYDQFLDWLKTGWMRTVVGAIGPMRDFAEARRKMMDEGGIERVPLRDRVRHFFGFTPQDLTEIRAAIRETQDLLAEFGALGQTAAPEGPGSRISPFDLGSARVFQAQIKSLEDYGEEWAKITPRIVDADEAAQRFLATLDPFARGRLRVFQDQIVTLDEWAEQWARITPSVEQTNAAIRDTTDATRDAQHMARELGWTFESAFEDAVIRGAGFRDVLQGIADDFQRIILRMTVTRPLAEATAGMIAGALSGGGGGTPIQTTGQVLAGLPQSADGNLFTRPAVTSIAERGQPEAVLPLERRDGRLGVRASGGGGQTIVNVRNQSGVQARVQRRRDGDRELVDILIPPLQEAIRRGGIDRDLRARFGVGPVPRGRA